MDNHWSDFIQTTEELYTSRTVRFHKGNKDVWLEKIGVVPGMNVLEIGCGGGLTALMVRTRLNIKDSTMTVSGIIGMGLGNGIFLLLRFWR